MKKSDCWVVIPAYNERAHIGKVVERVREQGFKKIVVVDDGSRDKTTILAKDAGSIALRHVVNMGKGAAMKTGADYAVKQGAKALIFLDGDGQHQPEELHLFLDELREGKEIVFGERKRTRNMPPLRRIGNWFIALTVKIFYNLRLQDSICGYRAVTRKAYKLIRWESRDYGVECEMIARAGKHLLSYSTVPVATVYHDRYKGMTLVDGFHLVWKLIWWRMTH